MNVNLKLEMTCDHCGKLRSIETTITDGSFKYISLEYLNGELIKRYKRHLQNDCEGIKK